MRSAPRRAESPLRQIRWTVGLVPFVGVVSTIIVIALSGCGAIELFSDECGSPNPPAPTEPLTPIAMALRYLDSTQVKVDCLVGNGTDYAGDWPQCFGFDRAGPYIRDISPFSPAFIHHALSLITENNRDVLELTDAEIDAARTMRTRAVQFMLRFKARDETPDAGTFGFWPLDQRWRPGDLLLASILECRWRGPKFRGYRAPANFTLHPQAFAIPTDADVTAVVYAALLDNHVLDDSPPVSVAFERFFADWRDLGQVPQRNNQPWIGEDSGAFLTWLAYRDDLNDPNPNDVDIVVNASVLYVLGRYGRLETPGVTEAIAVINEAITSQAHLSNPDRLSLYYPDNIALHYFVNRAYSEGGVTALAPAVDLLADDLLATVQTDADGRCFWDRGDAHLNTAFAILALLAADRGPDIVQSAISYLVSEQDSVTGAWEPDVFFLGRTDDGTEPKWLSPAFTTAMAMEALCRYRLTSNGG